jgi:uncharacterized membrane protein
MTQSSNQRVFKVVFVSLVFCLVSILVLIGLSTVASKYAKMHETEEVHTESSSTVETNKTEVKPQSVTPEKTNVVPNPPNPTKNSSNSKTQH